MGGRHEKSAIRSVSQRELSEQCTYLFMLKFRSDHENPVKA
jgi:hypothetical protein